MPKGKEMWTTTRNQKKNYSIVTDPEIVEMTESSSNGNVKILNENNEREDS